MAKEEIKEAKKEETVKESVVVAQLPSEPVRDMNYEGKDIHLITIEEALTEILEIARSLKKGLL